MTERIGERTLAALVAVLAAAVLVGGFLAIVADDDALPAEGARVSLDGVGQVERADGTVEALRDGQVLRSGDRVEMQEGTAVLELAGGGSVEIRSGRSEVDDSRVQVGVPTRLLAGDALAQGADGLEVEAAGTVVRLRGGDAAARIRRELAVTTGAYRGAVVVDSAGRQRDVPALRQLNVASVGRVPERPDPIEVDVTDPWDLRFLGGAIALTRSLDSLSATFTAQAPSSTPATLRTVLPDLDEEPGFSSSLVDADRPAGESLVGAAIAVLGARGGFADRWASIFEFRDDGADWGLVALDQDVSDGPVLAEVEAALSRTSGLPDDEVAVGTPTRPVTPPAPTTTTTTSPSRPSTTTTTTPPPPTTDPDPLVPPIEPPPVLPVDPAQPVPETGNDVLDELLEPIDDLLGGLLGG